MFWLKTFAAEKVSGIFFNLKNPKIEIKWIENKFSLKKINAQLIEKIMQIDFFFNDWK